MTTKPNSAFPHIPADAHDYERALMRMVELTLANPSPGTAEETELHMLSERTRRYESAVLPFRAHPGNGDVCACQLHCAGAACACWCHTSEVP